MTFINFSNLLINLRDDILIRIISFTINSITTTLLFVHIKYKFKIRIPSGIYFIIYPIFITYTCININIIISIN